MTLAKALAINAGFDYNSSHGTFECTTAEINNLIKIIVAECELAALNHARSYSDGDAATICKGAASAVHLCGRQIIT